MKKILPIIFFFSTALHAQLINLVSEGKSDYKIIFAGSTTHWDSLAAKELQSYLNEISSVEIPIKDDSSPLLSKEIIIGLNNRSEKIDLSSLKDDGFIIKTDGDKLYFLGGGKKGTLNAVYTFLEEYLNCRMYSSEVKIIPKHNTIVLPQINKIENPAFSYRSTHYLETWNDNYCHWHKLVDQEDKKIWGMFVHTFETLLPQEKYFAEHPEYFALRNNVRVLGQPCLTDPDVFKIMVDELKNRMEENPQAEIWSVSQNDNFYNCQCASCSKIDSDEGSPSGSLIHFVNKIAREFPDKTISTLAYQYTRKAPKNLKPDKNVNIMLCSIESERNKSLESDTSGGAFIHDLAEWSNITNNIIVWDYVVQFTNLVSPFPNFHVLQPNIKAFHKYNVPMIFEQGAGRNEGTEFGELRTYLIAKLLWNPYLNIESLMNDFLSGYYGKAGKYIREYIDLMTEELIKSKAQLLIYGNPVSSIKDYLAPELIKKYNQFFDEAEKSISEENEYLERVKKARLPLKYAMLEQAKLIGEGETGLISKDVNGVTTVNHFIISLLEDFKDGCKKIGNVYINEKQLNVDTYYTAYMILLSKTIKNPLGLFKPANFITKPSPKYSANGDKTLTDGLYGDENNYYFNWLGFEGENLEVILDLASEKSDSKSVTIKKVSIDFLQVILSWIFLPQQVSVSISDNGNYFEEISVVKNSVQSENNGSAPDWQTQVTPLIHTFNAEFESVETRYLKIQAENIKVCPPWHAGYPYPAWIFTDEIVVE
jgi:hypothetical protein